MFIVKPIQQVTGEANDVLNSEIYFGNTVIGYINTRISQEEQNLER